MRPGRAHPGCRRAADHRAVHEGCRSVRERWGAGAAGRSGREGTVGAAVPTAEV